MKTSIRPGFQTYLRALISDTAGRTGRRTLCTDCLKVLRQHRKLLGVSRRQLHALSLRSNPTTVQSALSPAVSAPVRQRRHLATVKDVIEHGPLAEYDERVQTKRLREDEHQRSKRCGRYCSLIRKLMYDL